VVDVRLGRLDRNAGLETTDDEQYADIAVVDEVGFARYREPFDRRHDRDPCIGPLGIAERRWHDADDRVRAAPEDHGSSDRAQITAELPLPESVAQHDGKPGTVAVVVRCQRATGRRARAEHVEKIAGHRAILDGYGFAGLQRAGPIRRGYRREIVEAVRLRPPVDEIRVRDLGAPAGLHATADDQPVLFREGKRPEHDRISQREQGGVRTDAEREERDGDERQLGSRPYGAQRLAHRHHGASIIGSSSLLVLRRVKATAICSRKRFDRRCPWTMISPTQQPATERRCRGAAQ
jgi:hypothetical protein